MSYLDTYFRHQCIINRLNRGPATVKEIEAYYKAECEHKANPFIFSLRTFLRDKEQIYCAYGVDVQWCSINRKYFINQ